MNLFGKAVSVKEIKKSLESFDDATASMVKGHDSAKRALTRALATGADSTKLQKDVATLQLALEGRPRAKAALAREARRAERAEKLEGHRAEEEAIAKWTKDQAAAGAKLLRAWDAFKSEFRAWEATAQARPAGAGPVMGLRTYQQFTSQLALDDLPAAITFELTAVKPHRGGIGQPVPTVSKAVERALEDIRSRGTERVQTSIAALKKAESEDPEVLEDEAVVDSK